MAFALDYVRQYDSLTLMSEKTTVIAMGGLKGGTGKSTIGLNIAGFFKHVRNNRVFIVDRDPQGGSTEVFNGENEPWLPSHHNLQAPLATAVDLAKEQGAEIIIIDSPPSYGGDATIINEVADLIIIPSRAAKQDLQAAAYTLMELQKKDVVPPAAVLINASDLRHNMYKETINALDEYGLPSFDNVVPPRTAFVRAYSDGYTIFNAPGNKKYPGIKEARAAISEICNEIEQFLNINSSEEDSNETEQLSAE